MNAEIRVLEFAGKDKSLEANLPMIMEIVTENQTWIVEVNGFSDLNVRLVPRGPMSTIHVVPIAGNSLDLKAVRP